MKNDTITDWEDTGMKSIKKGDNDFTEGLGMIIRDQWEALKEELKKGVFQYDDIENAKNTSFLKDFDSLFVGDKAYNWFETDLDSVFFSSYVCRAVKLNETERDIDYGRFIPNTTYINEDNRFSPKKVEWLYLSLGASKSVVDEKKAKECAEKECKGIKTERMAICEFINNSNGVKVVDLTIGDEWTLETQREEFRQLIYDTTNENPILADGGQIPEHMIKAVARCYASILSKELFVPVDTENKELTYAPFHCIASYFKSLNYGGIIYKSTVYETGKNLVLFNKTYAMPTGSIIEYVIE